MNDSFVLVIEWFDGETMVKLLDSMKSVMEVVNSFERNYGGFIKDYKIHKMTH